MMEELTTIQEIVERLEKLTLGEQRQVLDFALELTGELAKHYPGKNLLQLAGTISKEDLEIMKQTIEEGCGMASLSQEQHPQKP
ncbi:MAG: hypothetical protein OXC79_01055 [Candidatus Poribacteria bacterium]|nr:hypothetical protein [Candidatus Poribacteria bacterium]